MARRGCGVCVLILFYASQISGCAPGIGPAHDWEIGDQIEGKFRLERKDPPISRTPEKTIRLVTFNVHYGENIDSIASDLVRHPQLSRADLILLQEIRSFPDEAQSRAARLADTLGMGYVYAPARPEGNGTHGLAILSYFDLENVQVMVLPRAQLVTGQRRIALRANIQIQGKSVPIVNVHLDPCLNIAERMFQLRPAVVGLQSPSIVAGDFNTNSFLWAFDTIPEIPIQVAGDTDQCPLLDDFMSNLGYVNFTSSLGPTMKILFLESRLDAVYLQGMRGEGNVERTIDSSDHWPVWVDVELW